MLKFVSRLFALLLAFVASNWVFAHFYERERSEAIANHTHEKYIKWQAIKNTDKHYDLIFLGSSRGYCAYNPQQFDSITGLRSYNMCTASQNSIQSYYMLRDILKFRKPKFVVYELYLHSFTEHTDFRHLIENARFMTPDGGFELVVDGFGTSGVANFCLPLLKNLSYVKDDMKKIIRTESAMPKPLISACVAQHSISRSTT